MKTLYSFYCGNFERNIKINKMENGEYRFVTHVDITKEDLDYVLKTLKELIGVC